MLELCIGDEEQRANCVPTCRLRGLRSPGAVRLHSDGVSTTDLHEGQLRESPEVPGQDARRNVAGLGENVHQVILIH